MPRRSVTARTTDSRVLHTRPSARAHSSLTTVGQTPPSTGSERRVGTRARRSEEHTSELQSHLNLVCRLLLEKKKKHNRLYHTIPNSLTISTYKHYITAENTGRSLTDTIGVRSMNRLDNQTRQTQTARVGVYH